MKEINYFKNKFDKISLSKAEKAAGRDAFMQFIQKNPLPQQASKTFGERLSRFLMLSRRPLATAFATLTVFIMFGTGVTYAAQDSMPGELLYPIKIHVNEPVEGFFNFSPKSKAEWELDKMNRRLNELEGLKEQGPLDMKTKFQIKQQLDMNAQIFENHLKDLQSEGDAESEMEIRNQFQTLFEDHEDEALDIEFNVRDWGDTKVRPFPDILDDSFEEEDDEIEDDEDDANDDEAEVETEIETEGEVETE